MEVARCYTLLTLLTMFMLLRLLYTVHILRSLKQVDKFYPDTNTGIRIHTYSWKSGVLAKEVDFVELPGPTDGKQSCYVDSLRCSRNLGCTS